MLLFLASSFTAEILYKTQSTNSEATAATYVVIGSLDQVVDIFASGSSDRVDAQSSFK